MLASQLVFIGFESPSQFAEETRKADRTVPQAIVWSIIACGVLGGGLVLVLLFCIQVALLCHTTFAPYSEPFCESAHAAYS